MAGVHCGKFENVSKKSAVAFRVFAVDDDVSSIDHRGSLLTWLHGKHFGLQYVRESRSFASLRMTIQDYVANLREMPLIFQQLPRNHQTLDFACPFANR